MGLLDLLFGRKPASTVDAVADQVWISQQAKFAGIQKEIEDRAQSDSVAILLIPHFSDSLQRLDAVAAEFSGDTPVIATLAERLSPEIASSLNLDESVGIDLIVAERHPLLSVDDKLMQFAEELPCRCRVAHHLSFDDPLMDIFVSEWARGILDKLGMEEDEAIQSSMVSRRIKDAQKKIESESLGNIEASSAAEWFEYNMPNTSKS